MSAADVKLAEAVQVAWQNLYDAVLKAEAAGLKTQIWGPDGAAGECLPEFRIEVCRQYDIEIRK